MAMEEMKVSGSHVKQKIKDLLREGNVRRIVVRSPQGRQLIDLPLTAGVVGAAMLPLWAALGTVAALATDYTIAVERDPGKAVTKPPEA